MSDRSYSVEEFKREQRVSEPEESLAAQFRLGGLENPQREYRFHAGRRWRFDFAWPERKLAVEVEGLTRDPSKGGHQSRAGYTANLEKYNTAALMGWTILRFEQSAIRSGEALRMIEQLLREGDAHGA